MSFGREPRKLKRAHASWRRRAELFAKHGYDAVSIEDILAQTEIARGTFYLHFASKREMVGALLDELVSELTHAIVRVDASADHQSQLLGNFTRVVDVLCAHEGVAKLLFMAVEPKLAEKVEAFNLHALSMIERSLRAGRQLGLIRDLDIATAATVVFGGIRETALRRLFGRRANVKQRHAVAEQMLSLALFGLVATPAKV